MISGITLTVEPQIKIGNVLSAPIIWPNRFISRPLIWCMYYKYCKFLSLASNSIKFNPKSSALY